MDVKTDGRAGEPRARLISIDVLRAAAALVVLFSHIRHHADVAHGDLRLLFCLPLDMGGVGVQLFLVLSGFCIHLRAASSLAQGPVCQFGWVDFWKRRFFRLYPPYLAAMAFSLAVCGWLAFLGYPVANALPLWPRDIAAHLLMVQNLILNVGHLGDPPFWSLGLEEQLYALYAVFLLLRRRTGLKRTVLFTLSVSIAFGFASHWLDRANVRLTPAPVEFGNFPAWPLRFWFNWVVGAAAAEYYTRAARPAAWMVDWRAALLFGVVGFAFHVKAFGRLLGSNALAAHLGPWKEMLGQLILVSELSFAVCFFVLVNWCVRRDVDGRFDGPWLRRLAAVGVMSYSLYLVHVPVLHLLEYAVPLGDSLAATALRYALFTPVCLGAGYVFFRLVELRFLPTRRTPKPVACADVALTAVGVAAPGLTAAPVKPE